MHIFRSLLSILLILISSVIVTSIFATTKIFRLLSRHVFSCHKLMDDIYSLWINGNYLVITKILKVNLAFIDDVKINPKQAYLVIANHQGFFDIIILQIFCYRHGLQHKFFMKQALIFLPFIGIGCWGLDFVFIKRFSKQELKKYPHKQIEQYKLIQKKCQEFKRQNYSVVNFIEGTRKTPEKMLNSNYKNLLPPKAMGLSILIKELYPTVKQIIDVSLIYSDSSHFFNLVFTPNIKITCSVSLIDIESKLAGDYRKDRVFRKVFFDWLKSIWHAKDAIITKILA